MHPPPVSSRGTHPSWHKAAGTEIGEVDSPGVQRGSMRVHPVVLRLLARDNLMGVTRVRALSSYVCQAPRSATHRATLAVVPRRTLCRASTTHGMPCDAGADARKSSRLPRFYHSPLPATKGLRAKLGSAESRHVARVLRLKEGDLIELCDGEGRTVHVRLVSTDKMGCLLEAVADVALAPWVGPRWEVAVACGTLKGGRADWLVEKVAELGAKALIPLLTDRSPEVADGRASRLDRVAQAAAKQCLRTHALQVEAPARIQALVDRMEQSPLVLLATEGAPPLMTVLSSHPQHMEGGLLLIGPEGDFTPVELKTLLEAGAVPVGLGPLRLRAETAAIALLSTLMMCAADVR